MVYKRVIVEDDVLEYWQKELGLPNSTKLSIGTLLYYAKLTHQQLIHDKQFWKESQEKSSKIIDDLLDELHQRNIELAQENAERRKKLCQKHGIE